MSGPTPTTHTRHKPDFTDFFRSTHLTRQPEPTPVPQSSSTLEVPLATLVRKKSTRIPFLGRTRKKSNQSVNQSSSERDSTDIEKYGPLPEHRNSTATTASSPLRQSESIVAPSPKPAQPSFGSKLVAHFAPSKSRKSATLKVPGRSSPSPSTTTLSPPVSTPRGTSFESASSDVLDNRSSTPRQSSLAPAINDMTFTAEDVEQYKDLFTVSKNPSGGTKPPSLQEQGRSVRYSPSGSQSRQIASTSQNAATRKELHPKSSDSTQSTSSKKPPTLKPETSTPSRRPSTTSSLSYSDSTIRSRVKTTSGIVDRRNRGPTTPLPPPPPTDPPTMSLPSLPPAPSSPQSIPPIVPPQFSAPLKVDLSSSKPFNRPRAHSIAAITESTSLMAHSRLIDEFTMLQPDGGSFDINTATKEQLRQALLNRNKEYDNLASYLLKVTEANMDKITNLEKTISSMQREARAKELELKGLNFMLNQQKMANSSGSLSAPNSRPTSGMEYPQRQYSSTSATRYPLRRQFYTDDSGGESHPTSGAESPRSDTSGSESTGTQFKKGRKPLLLADASYSLYRASTSARRVAPSSTPTSIPVPLDSPYLTAGSQSQQRSAASSTSPTSSTSSLLPPSPSATVSSLSAIPESEAVTHDVESQGSARSSRRLSGSSFASSSTASSAYAANLTKGRPPSFATILEVPPDLDDALKRLRPFGPQGPPRPSA